MALEPKLPPMSPGSEKVAVGALLIGGQRAQDLFEVLAEDDFAVYQNALIVRAMVAARRKTVLAGRAEFKAEMIAAKTWEEGRTGIYFNEAIAAAMEVADVPAHVTEVLEKSTARKVLRVIDEMKGWILDNVRPISEIVAHFESDIFRAAEPKRLKELTTLHEAMGDFLNEIDRLESGTTSEKKPVPTGFLELDHKLVAGFKPGDLIIEGARPSVGKSSLALAHALEAAKGGTAALFFALEMRVGALAKRAFAMESDVPLCQIQNSQTIESATIQELNKVYDRKTTAPLFIDDSPSHTVASIAAIARRAVQRHGVGLIVIDYLQLIDHVPGQEKHYIKIGNTTRALKILARQLDVPIICLSQLNRNVEDRPDGRPQKSDLRDSGNIEQDADTIILLWPQDVADGDTIQEVILCVDKQRNGPQGQVSLDYNLPLTRFENPSNRWN